MREEGYYFVKWHNWTIAYWDNDGSSYGWHIFGDKNEYNDSLFQEIGDKIELPKDQTMNKVSYIIGFFLELEIINHFIPIKPLQYNHTNTNIHKRSHHKSIIPKNKSFDRNSSKPNCF